jgi:hypothetical protein
VLLGVVSGVNNFFLLLAVICRASGSGTHSFYSCGLYQAAPGVRAAKYENNSESMQGHPSVSLDFHHVLLTTPHVIFFYGWMKLDTSVACANEHGL